MSVIHLNYHEITEDPRVLKECSTLAARGVKVTVVCGLVPGKKEREKVGSLDVHRIPWMSVEHLTPDYLKELSEFPLSEKLARGRLEDLLPVSQAFKTVQILLNSAAGELLKANKEKPYSQLRGPKRLFSKLMHKRKIKALIENLKDHPEIPTKLSILEQMLKRAYANPKSFPVAKHGDVYQASAFLFDLNTRKLNLEAKFNVVHAHDIYTLVAGVKLAKAFGAKLIYDAHEYEPERASKMPPEGNDLAEAIELDCFRCVDALVTVSPGLCDLYAKRFTKRKPILIMNAPEIISPMPDDATLNAMRLAFREELGIEHDTPLMSYTGWVLGEQRGLAQTAEALRLMPDMHLVILGPRNEAQDANLLDIARNLSVSDRIHMLPPVPHYEVVPTIRACDVSIIPFQDATLSYRFAMPNKLFEGIFSGLPVAVADLPDMRKFVETLGRGKAMDASDPKSIAHTGTDLYERRQEYRLTKESFNDLVAKWSWTAQADRLYDLYKEFDAETNKMAQTH